MSNNAENRYENNRAVLIGRIATAPVYSHEVYGEGFFMFDMSVSRISENVDTVPVIISERMCDIENINVGDICVVKGQLRSYNHHEENRNRLVLSIFAREFTLAEETEEATNTNQIFLDGYICKPPVYRETPLGREIADILIAVNRPYGKSDYIPCIVWGRNARYASSLEVGQHIQMEGRIQSRVYAKRDASDNVEYHTAYELSVSRIALSM